MTAEFVAVEGPTGSGKTTIAGLLAHRLNGWRGHEAVLTAEPTRSPFGDLVRASEWMLQGRALALALAADRAHHVESMIIPTLDSGKHVITDRYVQSSMVLHRIDGLEPDEIWTYNQYFLQCTTVYLVDRPEVIASRLAARSRATRLELTGTPSGSSSTTATRQRSWPTPTTTGSSTPSTATAADHQRSSTRSCGCSTRIGSRVTCRPHPGQQAMLRRLGGCS
ncbi:dTMP kinase [Catellatospora bangladeshensis]|uniref:dTMP kinase n=1 Tax=Catellatospora bangladeshensis TaxID=310355 RepID=UPI003617FC9E